MPKMTKRVNKDATPKKTAQKKEEVKSDVVEDKKEATKKTEEVGKTGEKFYFKASDDFDRMPSHLICHSNNGSDHLEKTLSHARSKKLKKPILVEIKSDQKFPNHSLTVDEARELRDTLTKMIDYLEEV